MELFVIGISNRERDGMQEGRMCGLAGDTENTLADSAAG